MMDVKEVLLLIGLIIEVLTDLAKWILDFNSQDMATTVACGFAYLNQVSYAIL